MMLRLRSLLRRRAPLAGPSRACSAAVEPVEPPARVERGPTDILRALAGTVGTDYSAPHYKYHDDPWLTPYKNNDKRDFALAKEAGRKSARYILNKHPDLFENNRIYAEPPITAFQPRAAYNRDNVTVELLENLVSSHQVSDSMQVYAFLQEKKKVVVPEELKQSLLELVAFHNEEEAEEEGNEARGMLKAEAPRWQQGGLADQLYSEGGLATPEARLTLLLGYAKFGNKKGAQQMWEECEANGDQLPREAHHARLASGGLEGVERSMAAAREVLGAMEAAGLRPDTETLVCVLKVLVGTCRGPEYRQSCDYALDWVAEFRQAGVPLSIGVYKVLLDIFVDMKSQQKNTILVDILRVLEGQDMWPAVTLEDFYFFPRAMQVAMHLNRPALAWQVNELLLTGGNVALISHYNVQTMYYNSFLQNVLQNDSFEQAIELYYKVVPHLWSAGHIYYKNLLHAIHSHGALHHLGKVFDNMVLSGMGGANMETATELNHQVMQILSANDPAATEFSGLDEVWTDIAKRVFNHLEGGKDNRSFGLRFNLTAANICSLCIEVNLRQGNYEEAVRVFRFCHEESTVMPGQLTDPALRQLAEQSVALQEGEAAIEVVTYVQNMSSDQAVPIASLVTEGLELSLSQKEYLNKLFSIDPHWKPV